MSNISTRELAARWGVSKSRILLLAKEGRIPGAKQVGRTWVFPDNLDKPADMRTTAARQQKEPEEFRFPLYLYNNYSEEEIETVFTAHERELYRAELAVYKEDYLGAYIALQLLLGKDTGATVRAGALYYMCRCCIYLRRHQEFYSYYNSLQALVQEDIPYRKDLEPVVRDLDTYFRGGEYFNKATLPAMDYPFHPTTINYLQVLGGFAAALHSVSNTETAAALAIPYEMICRKMESEGCELAATLMHNYLSIVYLCGGDTASSEAHVRAALRSATAHGWLQVMATAYRYTWRIVERLPEEEFHGVRDVKAMSEEYFDCLQALQRYMGEECMLFDISNPDLEYLVYARQGLTNKEIAAKKGLSISTVAKRYVKLFEALGVGNKKELAKLGVNTLLNYQYKQTNHDE